MADRNVRIVKKAGARANVKSLPKTASTAFDKNSLVEWASGYINPSDDNDTKVYGIIKEEVASGDSDYASNTEKQVEVIMPGDLVEMTTSAELTRGTAYGISNAYTVDQSDTSNDVFTCEEVISSTKAWGYLKTYHAEGGN